MSNSAPGGEQQPNKPSQVWSYMNMPIVRNELNLSKNILSERFAQLSAPKDTRAYHSLGPVSQADEERVMGGLANVLEALEQFAKWSATEQSLTTQQRYLQHCKEASDKSERLQDNKRALAECRRLLERHTGRASRRKFVEHLEAIARDANVTFFSLESVGTVTPDADPTHCLSGQTFVLDLHVDQEGLVSWAKFQRILTDGSMVPDESQKGSWNWEQCQVLNVDICTLMHSTDMEAALKGKLRVLYRAEELHARHPEAAAFDRLHALEMRVIEMHQASGEGGGDDPCRMGVGLLKRLMEGLQMEYFETVGLHEAPKKAHALLQLTGVSLSADDKDEKAANRDKEIKAEAAMCLLLEPPVVVCAATAGLLQGLSKGSVELSLPIIRTELSAGPSWDQVLVPSSCSGKGKSFVAGNVAKSVGVGGLTFCDCGKQTGGFEVSSVPVASPEQISTALQLLRQQLALSELYTSCFTPLQDDAMDVDDAVKKKARPIVEVSVYPPGNLFIHVSIDQVKVALGGAIAAILHSGVSGVPPPCSDAYVSDVINTCRNVPLTLKSILGM